MSNHAQSRPFRGRLSETLTFARAFLDSPGRVGSVFPSSSNLSKAVIAPFSRRSRPSRVLEIGAGTGAITRHLCSELREGDQLTVCELRPDLANHIKRDILNNPQWADWMSQGTINLFIGAVQELPRDARFDFVVSGLPFSAFTVQEIRVIVDVIRSVLKTDGVFSYFEYVFLRRLSRWASVGAARQRVHRVSQLLDDYIGNFQISRRTVVANLLPAHARHWRFDAPALSFDQQSAVDSRSDRS